MFRFLATATVGDPGVTLDWMPGVLLVVGIVIATVWWHRHQKRPKADGATEEHVSGGGTSTEDTSG